MKGTIPEREAQTEEDPVSLLFDEGAMFSVEVVFSGSSVSLLCRARWLANDPVGASSTQRGAEHDWRVS